MGRSERSSSREVCSNTSLPQEERKTSNDNLTLQLKEQGKEQKLKLAEGKKS